MYWKILKSSYWCIVDKRRGNIRRNKKLKKGGYKKTKKYRQSSWNE